MRILTFFLVIFTFTGCSSPRGSAPVSDVTKHGTHSYYQSPTFLAQRDTSVIKGKTYRVQKGDTLFFISWRASLDLNRLALYNGLTAPYIIKEGEILKLTADEKSKTVYTKKPLIKKPSPSQNVQKNDKVSCADQSCNKNTADVVVQRKVKEYPAARVKVEEKVIKPTTSMAKVSDWQWPAKGKVIKTFADSQSGMKGISLANKRGTPVYTAASGEVVYAGSGLRGFGNLIIIKHNDDYLSAYAHNEQLLVKEKQQVKTGQKIAMMGDSGTDSVKLHFEIRYQGKSIDPLRYLPKRY
ncbi:peptidoglycan DD-metalloendopeptidase family protein [Psychromonas sp.]|uniref:peptidoglycan DD-metalloendopeptidase family protein n=1 Tax=Psychromonas sp. TaxID=1884585 RepID=UPI0035664261